MFELVLLAVFSLPQEPAWSLRMKGPEGSAAYRAAMSKDGRMIAWTDFESIRISNAMGKTIGSIRRTPMGQKIGFSPNGEFLGVYDLGDGLHLYDTDRFMRQRTFPCYGGFTFTPKGEVVTFDLSTRIISVSRWNRQGPVQRIVLPRDGYDVLYSMDISPNGKYLAADVSEILNHSFRVWDLETAKLLWSAEKDRPTGGVTWSPDGTMVVYGDCDGRIAVHEAKSGRMLREWLAFQDDAAEKNVRSFLDMPVFAPNGELVTLHHTRRSVPLPAHRYRRGRIETIPLSFDLSGMGMDLPRTEIHDVKLVGAFIQCWDPRAGVLKKKLVHGKHISALRFEPDGTLHILSSWGEPIHWFSLMN